jgi:hypothetical protein
MKDKLGKTPVFLMDDVFGEIDMYWAGMIVIILFKLDKLYYYDRSDNSNVLNNSGTT